MKKSTLSLLAALTMILPQVCWAIDPPELPLVTHEYFSINPETGKSEKRYESLGHIDRVTSSNPDPKWLGIEISQIERTNLAYRSLCSGFGGSFCTGSVGSILTEKRRSYTLYFRSVDDARLFKQAMESKSASRYQILGNWGPDRKQYIENDTLGETVILSPGQLHYAALQVKDRSTGTTVSMKEFLAPLRIQLTRDNQLQKGEYGLFGQARKLSDWMYGVGVFSQPDRESASVSNVKGPKPTRVEANSGRSSETKAAPAP